MGNGLVEIRALLNELSGAQRQVAEYVLAYPGEAPFLPVKELARRSGVSVASVTRFAQTTGYRNLRDLKASIGREALESAHMMFEAITKRDGENDIIEKTFACNIKSLEQTLQALDRDSVVRAARRIARAGRIVFLGIGGSGCQAADAALRFVQMDLAAEACSDAYGMVQRVVGLGKGDVAFGISHSGRSSMTVNALRLARENGAATLGISNYLRSPLHNASDIFFLTSFPESRVKAAALSSQIAQTCIIDALYLLTARFRNVSTARLERLNRHVENHLREGNA